MGVESKLLELVGSLHDSVVDNDKWLGALQQVAEFAGGSGAFHIVASPQPPRILESQSVGVDPVVNQRYLEYYASVEIRLQPALRYPVGRICTEQDLLEPRELRRSEIYTDLLAPFDIPHIMAAWLRKERAAFEVVVVEGSRRRGPFLRSAQERFDRIVPHLIRTAQLRDMLGVARRARHGYRMALEALPFGVILLDEQGCVVDATRSAEQILRQGGGLSVSRGHLRALRVDDDRRLERLVRDAVMARRSQAAGGSTSIRGAGQGKPLSVTVIPISPQEFLAAQPAALVVVVDPERAPQPDATAIQRMYGLTDAEAVLAARLFDGASLRETAAILGRSINTCKSQLKSIYQKTDCRHHADLAKKMLMAALILPTQRERS